MASNLTTHIALIAAPIAEMHEDRIYSTGQDSYNDTPQLGIYALAGALRSSGSVVQIVDLSARGSTSAEELQELVPEADAYLYSCNSMNWSTVRWIAEQLQSRRPLVRFIVGGPHCTLFPEHVLKSGLFDVVWKGDALQAVPLLMNLAIDRSADQNSIIVDGKTAHGSVLYSPAFDLMPRDVFCVIPVETSRGCKFQCTFCSIPSKRSWVPSGVEESVRRITDAAFYLDASTQKKVSIIDDTFTSDRDRCRQIFNLLDSEIFARRVFFDATAVDLLDAQFVKDIVPYTSDLLVGAEVSSKADSARIRKAATPDILRRSARNVADNGLSDSAVYSFIIGFPWQDKDDCLRTLEFACNLIIDYGICVYLQWYWPIPGSQIWFDLQSAGKVSLAETDTFGFFRDGMQFMRVRQMSEDDVRMIDARIAPLQMVFGRASSDGRRPALSYSPPPLVGEKWHSSRRGLLDLIVS